MVPLWPNNSTTVGSSLFNYSATEGRSALEPSPSMSAALLRQASCSPPDVRRPSCHWHRECATVQRDEGGAGAPDRDSRNPKGHCQLAVRRATCVRCHRCRSTAASRRPHLRPTAAGRRYPARGRVDWLVQDRGRRERTIAPYEVLILDWHGWYVTGSLSSLPTLRTTTASPPNIEVSFESLACAALLSSLCSAKVS